MAEVIKTKYMDKATRGYSEYIARDLNALQTISPKEGDRAILLDGSLYICVDNGIWDIAGGAKETDALIITVTSYDGRGYCTIDKTYEEIYSAAAADKTIVMIDPNAFTTTGLPLVLSPYSFNSDGSGTFIAITRLYEDMDMKYHEYKYYITVYPDSTVTYRWEELSQGGAEFNIAYGETAPEDTSKLWIKANEPESIVFGKDFEGIESIETVGNLPTATYGMGCARVANKVYLFGGRSGSSILNTINAFNLDTQEITTLETTLPTATYSMGCVSVGTKIYLFGGNNLNTINVFDTKTKTITTLSATLPYSGDTFCASVENKVYLFRPTYNTIYVFDIETETITTLSTTLPNSCYYWISIGTNIYIFQGNGYTGIYVFNTKTQTISKLSVKLPVSYGSGYSGVCSIGTKIYLFGGSRSNGGTPYNTIYELDIETETITTIGTTLPTGCYFMSCASIGTKIYLFGGYGTGALNTINKFSLTHDLTQNNIEVITGSNHFFNVVNTDTMKVEIGINSVLIGNENNQAENCEAYLYKNDAWVQI